MKDADCVGFLQWALPQLQMRWRGFRKVRGQVCKRVHRRLQDLELPDTGAYRAYLKNNPSEWDVLDRLCRITISRFCRDRNVFDFLGKEVFPGLAQMTLSGDDKTIRCWSAGCASGEEAYSIALLWNFVLLPDYPNLDLLITATDVDRALLERARGACFPPSSLKELPEEWRVRGFTQKEGRYCLNKQFCRAVRFMEQDIRVTSPAGPFHLVLCRNLPFTYFDDELQRSILQRIHGNLHAEGVLVVGAHESLPAGFPGFHPWKKNLPVYRKRAPCDRQGG